MRPCRPVLNRQRYHALQRERGCHSGFPLSQVLRISPTMWKAGSVSPARFAGSSSCAAAGERPIGDARFFSNTGPREILRGVWDTRPLKGCWCTPAPLVGPASLLQALLPACSAFTPAAATPVHIKAFGAGSMAAHHSCNAIRSRLDHRVQTAPCSRLLGFLPMVLPL